ncbi:hypothetical protein, partial [Streptomyces sp. NPDC005096]|uniref:hypothetical protein n=1 Tax=Streptomyces sp. NPDC005096 TaxID=3154559 RepID=UPI0033AE5541
RHTRHRLNTSNQTQWVKVRPPKLGQDSAAADTLAFAVRRTRDRHPCGGLGNIGTKSGRCGRQSSSLGPPRTVILINVHL